MFLKCRWLYWFLISTTYCLDQTPLLFSIAGDTFYWELISIWSVGISSSIYAVASRFYKNHFINVCMWSFPKFSSHFLNAHVTIRKRLTFALILFDYNYNFISIMFCLYFSQMMNLICNWEKQWYKIDSNPISETKLWVFQFHVWLCSLCSGLTF